MRFILNLVVTPALFAGLLVWAIFGTYRGSAVQDDYAWIIGAVVFVGGILLQSRLWKLREQLEALEKRIESQSNAENRLQTDGAVDLPGHRDPSPSTS